MTLALATCDETLRDTADALHVGTRLSEFEIRGVLGLGGFGIVYLARDHALERDVALKEYMPAALAGRGRGDKVSVRSAAQRETFAIGLRSFVNESRLLARFDHPSLVQVYRFWEDNGTAYMVMPYYKGRTLRQVRQAMALPPGEDYCRRLIDPLLSALERLHAEDVFHRDIAPDNILVGDDGVPVLLDFGAAREVISRTQSLTAILKPNFAPLEQYADMPGMAQGPWTDLYGLGATLSYLLTGQAPVPAAARALSDERPRLAAQPWDGCSKTFLEAVDWMLALRPAERPQSVAQLRDALDGRIPAACVAVTARSLPALAGRAAAAVQRLPAPSLAFTHGPSFVDVDFDPTQPAADASAPPRFGPRYWITAAAAAAAVLLGTMAWISQPPPAPEAVTVPVVTEAPATVAAPVAPSPTPPPVPSFAPAPAPEAAARVRTTAPPPAKSVAAVPGAATPPALEPAPAPRARADAAPAPAAVMPAAAPGSPSGQCADRGFLGRLACLKQQCETPAWREHADCRAMRAQEQAQRERFQP